MYQGIEIAKAIVGAETIDFDKAVKRVKEKQRSRAADVKLAASINLDDLCTTFEAWVAGIYQGPLV